MAFDSHSNFVEIQKLRKELNAKNGNLVRYDISHVADVDGQTEFAIDLSTFDYLTDSVWVVSGRTMLSATLDYTVYERSVILNEGVPVGRTVDIYIYKNVENLDTEKTINGLQIAVGSIPRDRIDGYVGGKMHLYTHTQIAEQDDQTEFEILATTYDETTDAMLVFAGQLMLHKDLDFTIVDRKIVLEEGVHSGCTITTYIFKQVEQDSVERTISGSMIAKGSIPLDRLAEIPQVEIPDLPDVTVTSDIPIHLSINESGGLRITYDDGN